MRDRKQSKKKTPSKDGAVTAQEMDVALPEIPPEHVDAILKLDNQLCFALYAASRLVVQSYTPLLANLGLTYPQYLVLLVLWEHDGLSVKELGKFLFLDSGTLTPVLSKLETEGFIARKRSAADDRLVQNFLTKKSKLLKGEAAKVPFALFCKSGMTLEETESLRESIKGLLRRV